jgi:hypothetical protein
MRRAKINRRATLILMAWLAALGMSSTAWSASTFWEDKAAYDFSQYGAPSWSPDSAKAEYPDDNFWVHDYAYRNGAWRTHTGNDWDMGGAGDSNAIVRSYGWGVLRKKGVDSFNQVAVQQLLDNGEALVGNLLHMKDASFFINNDSNFPVDSYIAKYQWLGKEGAKGAGTAHHLHTDFRKNVDNYDDLGIDWLASADDYPNSAEGRVSVFDLDGLAAHYIGGKNNVRYFGPASVASDTRELLPFLTLGADTYSPAVFGAVGAPLWAELPLLRRHQPRDFFAYGILAMSGLDRENPQALPSPVNPNLRWPVKSWSDDGDWNASTTRATRVEPGVTPAQMSASANYPSGNYQFYPFVAYAWDAQINANGKSILGYPVTLSVLPNVCSVVIDNDQVNETARRFESDVQGHDTQPGYYLSAWIERTRDRANWARWYPGAGVFRPYVYVPRGSRGTVRYHVVAEGSGDGWWRELKLDGRHHVWANLLAAEEEPIDFSTNGYIELSTASDSNPGLTANARIPFDAIKFVATSCAASTPHVGTSLGGTHPLNDTGITACGDVASQNNLDCSTLRQQDGLEWSAAQDAWQGRDRLAIQGLLKKVGGGAAGFDFTKLNVNGRALLASASTWACVRDNVTSLIWEEKTDDGGWRDKDWAYSWFNLDSASNGGDPGAKGELWQCGLSPTMRCNTQNYVNRANKDALCGYTDWRLPTVVELQSIVDFSRSNPTIDTNYFKNTPSGWYWTASPVALYAGSAWFVDFNDGGYYWYEKPNDGHVRLVRGGL